jgi:hypothetical protein
MLPIDYICSKTSVNVLFRPNLSSFVSLLGSAAAVASSLSTQNTELPAMQPLAVVRQNCHDNALNKLSS